MAILSYSHIVSSNPAIEPVSVETVKRNCDVDDDNRDADFARWITEARKQVERDTRRALITQTHVLKLDAFPDDDYLELPYPPLISVTSVSYVDSNGDAQTFASSNYSVDTNRTPGAILLGYSKDWPVIRGDRNSVTVTYTCGYGATAASVPEQAVNAIILLAKHRYEQPDDYTSERLGMNPKGYDYLVRSLNWGDYP